MSDTPGGKVAESDGWFVVNLADAGGERTPDIGAFMRLEPEDHPFPHFGINVHILEPGEPNGRYHAEEAQEAFLVLHGECVLIVEEQERPLRQWDFFHCPPGVNHIIVGAGEGPCAILMVGAREPAFGFVFVFCVLA
jgi:quercetin dioxygenase-like cupin family protein